MCNHLISGARWLIACLFVVVSLGGCGDKNPQRSIESAAQFAEKGDFRAATIELMGVLERAPDNAEARFFLGKYLLEVGDAAGAQVALGKAMELKHPVDATLPVLLRSYMAQGNTKKVIEEGRPDRAVTAQGKVDVMIQLASAYFVDGNAPQAKKLVSEALQMVPTSTDAQLAHARLTGLDGDLEKALSVVEAVAAKQPDSFDAAKLKGDLLVSLGQDEKAVAAFREVLRIRPNAVIGHAPLVYSLLRAGRFDSSTPQFADAVKQFGDMKKIAPNNPLTLSIEGQIAYIRKDFRTARDLSQKLLTMAPQSGPALQMAGAVEFNLGSLVQAEQFLVRSLAAAPDVVNTRRLLGVVYLRTGQPAKTLSILEQYLNDSKKPDADLLSLAGEAYLQMGDPKKAEAVLVRANQVQPGDSAKRTALAIVRLGRGDSETAFTELERVSATDKSDTADMALLAAHMMRAQHDRAIKALDNMDKKLGKNARSLNLRGYVLSAKGDKAGARQAYEQSLAMDAGYYPALDNIGKGLREAGKLDEAAARYQKFVGSNPKSVDALLALAETKMSLKVPPSDVLELLNRAVEADRGSLAARIAQIKFHWVTRNFKQAVLAAQDALAAIPDRAEILELLGQAQQDSGDINQALATYAKVAAKPGDTRANLRIAEIHIANKSPDAAIPYLRKALQGKPDLAPALRALVGIEIGRGKYDEALGIAKSEQKARPTGSTGYELEGDVLAARKGLGEAATAYRNALKYANSSPVSMKLHNVLSVAGKTDEARQFANARIKANPRDGIFRLYLAESAVVLGELESALEHYQAILDMEPDNPSILNSVAFLRGRLKRPGAIELAEKASRLAPDRPAYLDTLGMLLLEKGDVERAIDVLGKAARAAPDQPAIKVNLARALAKAGKKAEARKELEEIARLGEKFKGQSEVAKFLKEL